MTPRRATPQPTQRRLSTAALAGALGLAAIALAGCEINTPAVQAPAPPPVVVQQPATVAPAPMMVVPPGTTVVQPRTY